jgi:hypothetical protein
MIAFNEDRQPEQDPSSISPGQLKVMAIFTVLPIYVVIVWIIDITARRTAWLASEKAFPAFIAGCALGLGIAVFSFGVRRRILEHGKTNGFASPPIRGLTFALACCEAPAFFGLLHFIAFRDWSAFLILLLGTFLAFLMHAADIGIRKAS